MEERIQKTLENFRRHSFGAEYFETGAEAVEWILSQTEAGKLAGFGGSQTVHGLMIPEKLAEKGLRIADPETAEDVLAAELAARDADYYFCSANALIEDGSILNVDGTGNRVGACVFGPKHLFIVAGVNKLTADLDAAFDRASEAAVINCKDLGKKTPCVSTGKCSDCNSPDRSCRAYLLLRRPTRTVPTTLVLINETLGF